MKTVRTLLKILAGFTQYAPFLALLFLQALALYQSVLVIPVDGVPIWTYLLLIAVTVAMICNLYVQSATSVIMAGERPSMLRNLIRMDGKELAVTYNWLFAAPLVLFISCLLLFLYIRTGRSGFLHACTAFAVLNAVGVCIKLLAVYVQARQNDRGGLSRFLNPVVLPNLTGLILLISTNETTVGFVYRNTQFPESTLALIISLILLLIYLLALLFCYFCFFYTVAALFFLKRDPKHMEAKVCHARSREQARQDCLREKTQQVDKRALQVGLLGQCILAAQLIACHVKAFYWEYINALRYLLLLGTLQITRRCQHLLDTDRFRTNAIRFCESAAVLELLILDMALFIYLGSDDACSRFFELLSTVIIIPILLSSLERLKESRNRPS